MRILRIWVVAIAVAAGSYFLLPGLIEMFVAGIVAQPVEATFDVAGPIMQSFGPMMILFAKFGIPAAMAIWGLRESLTPPRRRNARAGN